MSIVALLLGGAAATVAIVAAASPTKDPDRILQLPAAFPPLAEPAPPRLPVPELDWHALAGGEIRIGAMAASPRFPALPPGDERIVLGEVAELAGRRGSSTVRVLADVYIEDTNDAASLVELARSLKSGKPPTVMPTLRHTAWGERLARDFRLVHGQAIAAGKQSGSVLPTQLATTPASRRFVGAGCNTIEQPSSEWRDMLASWGIADQRAWYLFDTAACGERGPAYPERRDPKTSKTYRARYNLRLEGRGSAVVITAEIARLPLVQLLAWKAYYGVR